MPNYYSRAVYPSLNGSTDAFSVPFPYISQAHVDVFTRANAEADLVAVALEDYAWLSAGMIGFGTPPAAGSTVEIRRTTPRDDLLTRLGSPSTATSATINAMSTQLLYIIQEDIDAGTFAVSQEGRYLRVGLSETVGILPTLESFANAILGFDSSLNPQPVVIPELPVSDGYATLPFINILDIMPTANLGLADCRAAIYTAISLVAANWEHDKPGGPMIWFPPGAYRLDGPINLKHQVTFVGAANGMAGAGQSTVFYCAEDQGGLICNFDTTNNGDEVVASSGGADGSVFVNLDFKGTSSGTRDEELYGIVAKCRVRLENCSARGFSGQGLFIAGDGPDIPRLHGNANCTKVVGGHYEGNLCNGILVEGGDANQAVIIGTDCTHNGDWGILSKSFLGCLFIGCHTSDNGMLGGGRSLSGVPGVVTYAADQFYVVPGQETAASTTAPGSNYNVWRKMPEAIGTRGTPNAQAPTWVSGTTYRAGGSYASLGGGTTNDRFICCYSEGGQGPMWLSTPAEADGGTLGAGFDGTGNWNRVLLGNKINHISVGYERYTDERTERAWSYLGSPAEGIVYAKFGSSTRAPSSWRWRHHTTSNDLILDYAADPAFSGLTITGPLTAQQFGRGAAVPHRIIAPEVFFGSTVGSAARSFTSCVGVPSNSVGGNGDLIWRTDAGVGQGVLYFKAGGAWIAIASRP